MMNNEINLFTESFETLQQTDRESCFSALREEAFRDLEQMGIPGSRDEEWKYTRIRSLFRTPYHMVPSAEMETPDREILDLPGAENANELFFLNGRYMAEWSVIRSENLQILSLQAAAESAEYQQIVNSHLNHSRKYLADGMNALNTAFLSGGMFLYVPPRCVIEHPVYIYNITDTRNAPVLALPRSLMYIAAGATVRMVEVYRTTGVSESLTNQVSEVVVEENASVEYYKIQNDVSNAHLVSTAHIRQIGRSVVNTVTISLSGGMVRNNLHAVMEAPYTEAHMYGLYLLDGKTHVDNHTIVDNRVPGCLSNELYKGVLNGSSTAVFNGKIFVRKDAQQINAFQSNKNIILSDDASVNTKPQLEIFADDVKCSHGCTIGSMDENALFYLQSRGITKETATGLLLRGFSSDIVEKIQYEPVRHYAERLIADHLNDMKS